MKGSCSDGPIHLADVEQTEELGARLAREMRPGTLVLLEGPLGVGKTCLVRGLVRALGGDPSEVCSPTFILLESYQVAGAGIRRLHHADLYRLRGHAAAPWDEVGLAEVLDDPEGVTAVEWAGGWEWGPMCSGPLILVKLDHAATGRTAVVRCEQRAANA